MTVANHTVLDTVVVIKLDSVLSSSTYTKINVYSRSLFIIRCHWRVYVECDLMFAAFKKSAFVRFTSVHL